MKNLRSALVITSAIEIDRRSLEAPNSSGLPERLAALTMVARIFQNNLRMVVQGATAGARALVASVNCRAADTPSLSLSGCAAAGRPGTPPGCRVGERQAMSGAEQWAKNCMASGKAELAPGEAPVRRP